MAGRDMAGAARNRGPSSFGRRGRRMALADAGHFVDQRRVVELEIVASQQSTLDTGAVLALAGADRVVVAVQLAPDLSVRQGHGEFSERTEIDAGNVRGQ